MTDIRRVKHCIIIIIIVQYLWYVLHSFCVSFCTKLSSKSVIVCCVFCRLYLKRRELEPESSQLADCPSSLLQLSIAELGRQLTEKDFQLYRNIEPTEYLADLFHCDCHFGTPNLTKFSQVATAAYLLVSYRCRSC